MIIGQKVIGIIILGAQPYGFEPHWVIYILLWLIFIFDTNKQVSGIKYVGWNQDWSRVGYTQHGFEKFIIIFSCV